MGSNYGTNFNCNGIQSHRSYSVVRYAGQLIETTPSNKQKAVLRPFQVNVGTINFAPWIVSVFSFVNQLHTESGQSYFNRSQWRKFLERMMEFFHLIPCHCPDHKSCGRQSKENGGPLHKIIVGKPIVHWFFLKINVVIKNRGGICYVLFLSIGETN